MMNSFPGEVRCFLEEHMILNSPPRCCFLLSKLVSTLVRQGGPLALCAICPSPSPPSECFETSHTSIVNAASGRFARWIRIEERRLAACSEGLNVRVFAGKFSFIPDPPHGKPQEWKSCQAPANVIDHDVGNIESIELFHQYPRKARENGNDWRLDANNFQVSKFPAGLEPFAAKIPQKRRPSGGPGPGPTPCRGPAVFLVLAAFHDMRWCSKSFHKPRSLPCLGMVRTEGTRVRSKTDNKASDVWLGDTVTVTWDHEKRKVIGEPRWLLKESVGTRETKRYSESGTEGLWWHL
jgi:hypothetical protein